MSDHLNDYCTWTCVGVLESVDDCIDRVGLPYKTMSIQTHMGSINLYLYNQTLFDKVNQLTLGRRIEAKGFLGIEYQSQGGKSPYFLRPSEIRTCDGAPPA